MAPVGRERAIQLVQAGKLPIWIGSPHPFIMIVEQEGAFRIRELVVDMAEAMTASSAARAAGRGWMPENHYALGKPTGNIFAESKTRDGLVEIMKTMQWPKEW